MHSVVIADDHALFRSGLRQLLERDGQFTVVGEAGTAAQTLDLVRARDFDALLLDLSMPGRSGVDLVRQVRTVRPSLPVLVLSMHAEEQYALRALAAGASAYLTKDARGEELVQALERIVAGGRYIGATVAELMAQDLQPHAPRPPHRDLSDREFEILHALVGGESVTAVAQRLHLSVKTVSTHKTHILQKLGCASFSDLVRYAVDHGISGDSVLPG